MRARGCVPKEGADDVEGTDDARAHTKRTHLPSIRSAVGAVPRTIAPEVFALYICAHMCAGKRCKVKVRDRKQRHTQRIPHAEHASPHAAHAHTLYHLCILLERPGGCPQPTWDTTRQPLVSQQSWVDTPSKQVRALTHRRAQSWRRVRPLPRHRPPLGLETA